MTLNTLLAGPILRRTEKDRTFIWLATSCSAAVVAEVYRAKDGDPGELERIGGGAAQSVKLGENVHVHLVCATPVDETWPVDELLAYDLRIVTDDDQPVMRLGDLGLLDGRNKITYGSWSLPTFFVREKVPLRVVHGSCRLLHGRGDDALAAADELLRDAGDDLSGRPCGLFLTGDQIYADDVASPLIGHIRDLADELIGPADDLSVPGVGALSGLAVGSREDVVREKARFTSSHCDNHLMSIGEFIAMYVCAWNHENWPVSWPDPDDQIKGSQTGANAFRSRRTWAGQANALERARLALPAVRRLFANVPTYMIFDDHDVTDDWNLTEEWIDQVRASPTGRRVVANALGTYWAFQGWGNDPDVFDATFKKTVVEFAQALNDPGGEVADAFDALMWTWEKWSYRAPVEPTLLCADTRTQRSFDSPEGAARLIGKTGLDRLVELARDGGHEPGQPLMLVSAVPVFGFELQERRQKFLVDKVGPYDIDFEAWHSNLRGLVDFMQVVLEELRPSYLVLLSGDVHYGVNARAAFEIKGRALPVVQLVSSGQKHAGVLARTGIDALGRVLMRKHVRLGWDDPPATDRPAWVEQRILQRPVNTDEWSGESPVFVSPRDVRLLGIDEAPDYRECRVYVKPREPNSSLLLGLNNVGVVTLQDDKVEHRLLGRKRDETEVRTTVLDPTDGDLFA